MLILFAYVSTTITSAGKYSSSLQYVKFMPLSIQSFLTNLNKATSEKSEHTMKYIIHIIVN